MARAAHAYQIKVTLNGTKPPVWRRLLVRSDTRLDQLHQILQVAMGWTNCHLHQFSQKVPRATPREIAAMYRGGPRKVNWDAISGERFFADPDFELDGVADETRVRLDVLLCKPKDKLGYEYDFGDGWEHDIVMEKTLPVDDGPYPRCLAGKLNGPPEDCGGIGGYYDIVEMLADPDSPRDGDLLEWLGDYDPNHFDVEEINAAFRQYAKRWKRR
jgi:hypothetical protein